MTAYADFIARFGLDPRLSKTSVLSLPCPLCQSGRITARQGQSGELRLGCSNGCHAGDFGRAEARLLQELESAFQAPDVTGHTGEGWPAGLTISIGVNRSLVGKLPADTPRDAWQRVNCGFVTERLDIAGLAHVIQSGYAITAVHKHGERKQSNFISAQHIGLDFDTGDQHSSLDFLLANNWIHRYAALLHTTASHTSEKPRARVIFVLDEPIKDARECRRLTHALLRNFPAADAACFDASRLWYGALDCECRVLGKVLPLRVLQALARRLPSSLPGAPKRTDTGSGGKIQGGEIPPGRRNTTLASIAGRKRRQGMDEDALLSDLLELNRLRCRPPLSEDEVRSIARSIAHYAPSPARDRRLLPPLQTHVLDESSRALHDREGRGEVCDRPDKISAGQSETPFLQNTSSTSDITSERERLFILALTSPLEKHPVVLLDLARALIEAERLIVTGYAKRTAAAGLCAKKDFEDQVRDLQRAQRQADTPPDSAAGDRQPTHDELMERWLQEHPLTVYSLGSFYRYASGVWSEVKDVEIKHELHDVIVQAKPEGVRPTGGILKSVFELAMVRTENPDTIWNPDPYIVACTNGALNVLTGELKEHSPEHYLTGGFNFAYDPNATAPQFEALLDRQMPDAKEYFLEFGGYCLTPLTHYETATFFYGLPGCGKSTLVETMHNLFGTRAGVLSLEDQNRGQFSLTHLPGKTLMTATEMPEDFHNTKNQLNQLISGERIPVDRKYKDPLEITPTAKYLLAMNEPPRLSPGSGLFRRLVLIEMHAIPEAERDPGLKHRLAGEYPGILNLLIEGLHRLNARGRFDLPAAAHTRRDAYQRLNDTAAAFVAECCLRGEQYRAQSGPLYTAYQTWCRENGHHAKSSNTLSQDWKRLGFKKKQINGKHYWFGIGLVDAEK